MEPPQVERERPGRHVERVRGRALGDDPPDRGAADARPELAAEGVGDARHRRRQRRLHDRSHALLASAHRVFGAVAGGPATDGSKHDVLDPVAVLSMGRSARVPRSPWGPPAGDGGAGENVLRQDHQRPPPPRRGPQQARASRRVRRARDVGVRSEGGHRAVARPGRHRARAGGARVSEEKHAMRVRRRVHARGVRRRRAPVAGRREGASAAASAKVGERRRRAAGLVPAPGVRHRRVRGGWV